MSAPILDLLASCGVPLARDDSDWSRLVMLHNLGGLPGDHAEGDLLENRGFNLLVVDSAGSPTHFCKFRPAAPGGEAGESLVARLSRSPDLAAVIPETRSVHTDEIDAEVSRYIRGELLERRLPSMPEAEIRTVLADIIRIASRLSLNVARAEPALLAGGPSIGVQDAAAWALDALRDAGLDARRARVIDALLARVGTLPRTLQHGDLWPRNALFHGGHWWILDLDFFGRVQMPMYDAFHLVRTAWDALPSSRRGAATWIDALTTNEADCVTGRSVLAEASGEARLSPLQAGGAFAYYIVDIAARLYSRRLPSRYVDPFIDEARRLADWIASGRAPEELFL